MRIESFIRLLAGTFVLLGIGLAQFISPWWMLLPAFVGANLIQSVFTGFCPPSLVLRQLGWLDDAGIIRWGGASGSASRSMRFVWLILAGAALGATVGYYRECTDGSCPLQPTWWKGALVGVVIGAVAAAIHRSPTPRT
jgi:hypothetical protein